MYKRSATPGLLLLALLLAGCRSSAAPAGTTASSSAASTGQDTVVLTVVPAGVTPTTIHQGGTTLIPPKPRFLPKTVTIKAGGVVEWIDDEDGLVHTVTAGKIGAITKGGFDSGFGVQTHKGSVFIVQFNKAGTYPYFCQVHGADGMVGTVTVQ